VDPAVLVSSNTADDAAVFQITDELAIVHTVDFFTPIVDDPYQFGAISAANSLSDIYAMGAKPLFALNVVGFPEKRLPLRILKEILRGAHEKAEQAGIPILGGHTVEDTEPKFGLSVTGLIHPDQVIRNSTACPGDVLILTKPIGLGILTTAIKRGLVSPEDTRHAIEVMGTLNKAAADAMLTVGVNACTDITGFGLLGHLYEMTLGSGVEATLSAQAVPVLSAAWDLAGADVIPGGTLNNLAHVADQVSFNSDLSRAAQLILADAQTSGGLLISLPESKAASLLSTLKENGVSGAAQIGKITGSGQGQLRVEK
jgi:selenide,water dikinase